MFLVLQRGMLARDDSAAKSPNRISFANKVSDLCEQLAREQGDPTIEGSAGRGKLRAMLFS